MENGWAWNIWSCPTTVSRTTALFAANGRCCTTMQVSVKIETEETASSDAQMNGDGCVISEGFRVNVPPGLIGSRQPRPQHSDCVGELREVGVCCCGGTGLWLSDRWGQHCCKIRRGLLEHFCTTFLKNTVPVPVWCHILLYSNFRQSKNSDRRTYDTKMSAILPVTKVKPAAMARWLRAKPGSWILLSICRPQGGTKKLAA